jgi:chromosome segregation ATPase
LYIDSEAVRDAEIEDLKAELALEKEKSGKLQHSLDEANLLLKTNKAEITEKDATIAKIQAKIDDYLDQISTLKDKLAELDKELNLKILDVQKYVFNS